jgi:hypothetical protein
MRALELAPDASDEVALCGSTDELWAEAAERSCIMLPPHQFVTLVLEVRVYQERAPGLARRVGEALMPKRSWDATQSAVSGVVRVRVRSPGNAGGPSTLLLDGSRAQVCNAAHRLRRRCIELGFEFVPEPDAFAGVRRRFPPLFVDGGVEAGTEDLLPEDRTVPLPPTAYTQGRPALRVSVNTR